MKQWVWTVYGNEKKPPIKTAIHTLLFPLRKIKFFIILHKSSSKSVLPSGLFFRLAYQRRKVN